MLRITAKQQLMREIVDVLSVLTAEAKLVWGENGLSVRVVDGMHVALLSATFADECFETYEVTPTEVGLDLVKMRDMIALANPDDLIEMDIEDEVMINVRVGGVVMSLRGLDLSMMTPPNEPGVEFKNELAIDSEKLIRAFKGAKLVGSEVDLTMENNTFIVSSSQETGDRVTVKFESGELRDLSHVPDGAYARYGLTGNGGLYELMRRVTADSVSMKFNTGHPLFLEWSSNEGGAKWKYWLAPRMVEP
jgi:proliferating cell nuclear antigen